MTAPPAKPPRLFDRLSSLLAQEGAWWQAPLLAVLAAGVLLLLYLYRTQQTEFIYALF